MKETYRTDKANKLDEKAKRAHHFHAKQAHVLTSENLEKRESNVKKATKRSAKQQEELNAANAKTSKAMKKKKFSGEFNFY
ncbi:MAG: hypothetical protein ACTHJT_12165 [Cytophaga sp.]|uniref:hypothetical protein n=1 Tax=Cytophaga sp. TaxID=29535 RepID=UPI003F7E9103